VDIDALLPELGPPSAAEMENPGGMGVPTSERGKLLALLSQ
jgi:hypothetical protein